MQELTEKNIQPIKYIEQGYRGRINLTGVTETAVLGNFRDLNAEQQLVRLAEEAAFPPGPSDRTITAMNPFPYGTTTHLTVYDDFRKREGKPNSRLGDLIEIAPASYREMCDRAAAAIVYMRNKKEPGRILAGNNKGQTRSDRKHVHLQVIHEPPTTNVYPVNELLNPEFIAAHNGDPHMNGAMYGLVANNVLGHQMILQLANRILGLEDRAIQDTLDLEGMEIFGANLSVPLKVRVEELLQKPEGLEVVRRVNHILEGAMDKSSVPQDRRCAGIFFSIDNDPERNPIDNGALGVGVAVQQDAIVNCGLVEFDAHEHRVRGLEKVSLLSDVFPGIDQRYHERALALGEAMRYI